MICPGDVIRTNYGTGPYVVEQVREGCTCHSYLYEISRHVRRARNRGRKNKKVPPHLHLVCRDQRDGGRAYLNRYVWTAGGRLLSVDANHPTNEIARDEILIVSSATAQLSIF